MSQPIELRTRRILITSCVVLIAASIQVSVVYFGIELSWAPPALQFLAILSVLSISFGCLILGLNASVKEAIVAGFMNMLVFFFVHGDLSWHAGISVRDPDLTLAVPVLVSLFGIGLLGSLRRQLITYLWISICLPVVALTALGLAFRGYMARAHQSAVKDTGLIVQAINEREYGRFEMPPTSTVLFSNGVYTGESPPGLLIVPFHCSFTTSEDALDLNVVLQDADGKDFSFFAHWSRTSHNKSPEVSVGTFPLKTEGHAIIKFKSVSDDIFEGTGHLAG